MNDPFFALRNYVFLIVKRCRFALTGSFAVYGNQAARTEIPRTAVRAAIKTTTNYSIFIYKIKLLSEFPNSAVI